MTKLQSQFGNPANYNIIPETRLDGDASALEVDGVGNLKTVNNSASSLLLQGSEADTIGIAPFRRADAFQAQYNSSDASSAAVVKAATTNKSTYITDVVISVGSAVNVKLQDNAGTPVVLVPALYLPANSVWSKTFSSPIQVANGNALNVLASGAGNISVLVTGYVI